MTAPHTGDRRTALPARALRAAAVLAAAIALGAAMLAPASASAGMASKLTVGIAEQQPDFFSQPLFERTGIHHARLLVGWNAMYTKWQREQADTWLAAAQAAGVTPLVSFGHSRSNRRDLPSVLRFTRAFRAFHERYPGSRRSRPGTRPTTAASRPASHPEKVAAYWRAIRVECPSCRVLAAELLDSPNMAAWARAFRRASKVEPKLWGLHNYIDANRFTTGYTR